jgi:Fe-S cluster assembly protein SufD
MIENFEINSSIIDNIEKITNDEKKFRIKNLELFKETGFPNKKFEDWKFSDFRNIVSNNFEKIDTKKTSSNIKKINLIKDFEHNYIFLVNGNLHSSNFDFEDNNKIKIKDYENNLNYKITTNPLICLNHALAENGYLLEVDSNYKFKKVLVVYNYFTKDIKDQILNNKNTIKVKENSELHIIDYTINESEFKFINNVYENIVLEKNSKLRHLYLQNKKSHGFFYKYLKNELSYKSDYSNLIFTSGLKFNKLEIECDLNEKNCSCNILSALFLNKNEHQEIKTRINHLAPDCKSYQRIKNVLNSQSKGVYQGKIYVKDIAQKTDAYQLSKALLLKENAEFNSKPELEIYADDVKCSHGSTSGSIDEDSIFYLMTRGLSREDSSKLLIKAFLNDVIEFIKSPVIKKFVETKLEEQVSGY